MSGPCKKKRFTIEISSDEDEADCRISAPLNGRSTPASLSQPVSGTTRHKMGRHADMVPGKAGNHVQCALSRGAACAGGRASVCVREAQRPSVTGCSGGVSMTVMLRACMHMDGNNPGGWAHHTTYNVIFEPSCTGHA